MSSCFHRALKYKWTEAIAKKVSEYISQEFKFEFGQQLREENIDPCLRRLLVMIKQYMQTVIFDYFENALRDYLKFLLSFALRDETIKSNPIMDEVRYDPWLQLKLSKPDPDGLLVNDIELIQLKTSPLVKVYALIEDVQQPRTSAKKPKITTNPSLVSISEDLFQVV